MTLNNSLQLKSFVVQREAEIAVEASGTQADGFVDTEACV
jgi:hypothetical protein